MHIFDTLVFDHHEMLNYTKFGNEEQHSQILSPLLHEEEVCKTVNQAVTLPVGLLQRHHARAPYNRWQRAIYLGVNTGEYCKEQSYQHVLGDSVLFVHIYLYDMAYVS